MTFFFFFFYIWKRRCLCKVQRLEDKHQSRPVVYILRAHKVTPGTRTGREISGTVRYSYSPPFHCKKLETVFSAIKTEQLGTWDERPQSGFDFL